MRFAVCGCGKRFYQLFRNVLKIDDEIVGLFDNNQKIEGKYVTLRLPQRFVRLKIENMDKIFNIDFDYCLITPENGKKEIRDYLVEIGVAKEKIAYFHRWIDPTSEYYVNEINWPYREDTHDRSFIITRMSRIKKIFIELARDINRLENEIREGEKRKICNCGSGVILHETSRITDETGNSAVSVGKNSIIKGEVLVWGKGSIRIGDYCYVGENTHIWSCAGVQVGKGVLIGHDCNIIDNDTHPQNTVMRGEQYREIITIGQMEDLDLKQKEIVIEDDVWIGEGCTIFKGVHIGKGSIIGANTLILHDVPRYSLVHENKLLCEKKIETNC